MTRRVTKKEFKAMVERHNHNPILDELRRRAAPEPIQVILAAANEHALKKLTDAL